MSKKNKLFNKVAVVKHLKFVSYFNFILSFNLFLAAFLVYMFWDLPDYKVLRDYNPASTTRVYSSEGVIISEFATEKRSYIAIDSIPDVVKYAFLSAEDKGFYEHSGFSYRSIAKAMYDNFRAVFTGSNQGLRGASTITQQVVKNLLLSRDKTIKRKLREAVLTRRLEKEFTKDQILEMYLNEIYLGNRAYGVSSASLEYFNKSVTDLKIEEAALLASLPKAPSYYNPDRNYDAAFERRNWVIERMAIDGKITQEDADLAKQESIKISSRTNVVSDISRYVAEDVRRDLVEYFGSHSVYKRGYFVKTTIDTRLQRHAYNALRKGIVRYENKYGWRGAIDNVFEGTDKSPEDIESLVNSKERAWLNFLKQSSKAGAYRFKLDDWRISLVLDVKPQSVVLGLYTGETVTMNLDGNKWAYPYEKKKNRTSLTLSNFKDILKEGDVVAVEIQINKSGSKSVYLRQIPEVNGAMVAIDINTGKILAMQGGFSYKLSSFNRAKQAKRQPGSTFKPFVYLPALESGISPLENFLDAPMVIRNEDGSGDWRPTNYKDNYQGFVTLRDGLERSRNNVTLRIANRIGLNKINKTALDFGIYDKKPSDLTVVLGAYETDLISMTNAFAMIANGGKKLEPFVIREIRDSKGNVLSKYDNKECSNCSGQEGLEFQEPPQIDLYEVYLSDEQSLYQLSSMLRGVITNGSGRRAYLGQSFVAGKTGTSNDSKDTWFIGYSSDIAVGVYIGYDTPKSLGSNESGGTVAAPIFRDFMQQALRYYPSKPLKTPGGLELVWVDRKTGNLSHAGAKGAVLESLKQNQSYNEVSEYEDEANVEQRGIF